MAPLSLTDEQRLVLSCSPHFMQLLDALNVRGDLQVLDLRPDRSTVDVLQIECHVQGLHPSDALAWAHGHSQAPMLRVHAPTARLRACTLWFGKVQFEGLPDAYLRLVDGFHAAPSINRMQLFGSATEPRWVWHEQRETYYEEGEQELERLCVLTGAAFASVEAAADLLEELEAFVLIHFQAHGTTRIEWPAASRDAGEKPPSSSQHD